MEDKSFSINLKCVFCDSPLEGDTDKQYLSGDMLKCTNCQELNDYDSVMQIAQEEGVAIIEDEVKNELSQKLKDMFKK